MDEKKRSCAIVKYEGVVDKLFALYLEAQKNCIHFSAYMNRPEVLERYKSLVDQECLARRKMHGDEGFDPFSDPQRYCKQIKEWEEDIHSFDENSIPPDTFKCDLG